jgi:NTP pyrophosphatase (non-canonical NTP hydrolase)
MKHETIERIRRFTEDRDWKKFHTPANLAKSISIEANELLECFQWSDTDYDIEHVKEELADVLVYCRNMLDELGLDEDEIVNTKMDQNEAKYPVEKAKGSAAKYTSYEERDVSSVLMRMPGICGGCSTRRRNICFLLVKKLSRIMPGAIIPIRQSVYLQ